MDHSNHGMGMDMMKMYFHGGYTEVILFDFWRIDSLGGLIGSMVAIYIMAIAYEGLKFLRESLIMSHTSRSSQRSKRLSSYANIDETSSNPEVGGGIEDTVRSAGDGRTEAEVEENNAASVRTRTVETPILSRPHFILTLIHLVQICMAYFLMLIFMTYNTWLCLAVVFGAASGYFLFGWRKTLMLEEADHCH